MLSKQCYILWFPALVGVTQLLLHYIPARSATMPRYPQCIESYGYKEVRSTMASPSQAH